MSFNAGAQISDTSFKSFVGILPKVPFFLLFKAVVPLSISLASVLTCVYHWDVFVFHKASYLQN